MTQCPNCSHQNRDGARFCALCRTELFPSMIGDDYRVLSVIDSGGMGRVYKAERQGQIVAVKEVKDTFRDAKARQDAINRFMAEALTLARLKHPNIPVIHRNFVENGRYYLVMDWIEGQDLRALMKQRGDAPLPEEQVLDWALQLCDVLEYLHGQNPPIIFRDLKPANIILQPDGRLVLVDFGIAKLFAPGQQGTLIGTPGYAAMEQYQGLADPRSDIYGLGVTLYFLLTGRDPQQNAPFIFPPAASINPAVSAQMESILHKAMEYRLDDRWASAGEIRQRLLATAGPSKVEIGTILSGRYQVTKSMHLLGNKRKGEREYYGFMAKDLKTGAECGVFPLGEDSFVDGLVRQLATLHHATLPRTELISQRNASYFVCERALGTELHLAAIQDNSLLTSIGLQMCSLFQETGSRGVGFGWGELEASNVLVDSVNKVWIDLLELFLGCVWKEDSRRSRETISIHSLCIFLPPFYENPKLNHWEAGEAQIVGLTMWIAVTGEEANWTMPSSICRLSKLFSRMPGISPALATLIVGVATQETIEAPWIGSLAALRNCLISPPPPARAQISDRQVDFGAMEWGEKTKRSIRLWSVTQGRLCADIPDTTEGLQPSTSFISLDHPCDWVIQIEWDTSKLDTCGDTRGQVTVVTPAETFPVTTQANVHPNATFHRTRAQVALKKSDWSDALRQSDQAIRMDPQYASGYSLRASALSGLQRFSDAAQDLTQAIRLAPNDPQHYWDRSQAYEAMGSKQKAISDLQVIISLGGWRTDQAKQKIAALQGGH